MSLVFSLILGLLLIAIGFEIFSSVQRGRYNAELQSTVLRVAVSKLNERGPIVAEQIWSAVHAIEDNHSWMDHLLGKPKPRISLEIATINNTIQFFIWTPRIYKNVIESQIYAQYPDVEIEEVEDYAKAPARPYEKPEQKTEATSAVHQELHLKSSLPVIYSGGDSHYYAVTAELKFTEPDIYPIKRYGQFEDKLTRLATESLAGVCATLSKLNATDEQAWIQICIEPVGDWWRKRGLKTLKVLNKGLFKNIFWLNRVATDTLLARGFWKRLMLSPVYLFFWIFRGIGSSELPMVSESSHDELREEMSRAHDREDPITAALGKVTNISYDASVRIVYVLRRENLDLAEVKLNEIAGSFRQYTLPNLNGFKVARINQANAAIFRRYQQRLVVHPMILSTEEIATLYHMPHMAIGVPNLHWVNSRKLEPPAYLPNPQNTPANDLTIIGKTNFRGRRDFFGIKGVDRRRHIYIIGKTGMGKSVLLENMIHSDVNSGRGLAVIDPHGDLADAVINFVPANRTNDVVILDPSDSAFPFAFNMLEGGGNSPDKMNLIASGLLGVFKKMYAESWGPRLEHILRNCILALAENQNTSILGIMRILVDNEYRRKMVDNVTNPLVRSFWIDEFGKMQDKLRTEAISPIQNKVGQFLSSPMIRNILGQVKSTVNIRFMMDTGKIVIVNLSKGKMGEDNSSLMGSLLITKFQLDAMSRADVAEKDRKDFYLYVDEFQNFATDAFATILSEARKYKLNLTMANQYINQMPEEVRDAVFGNVGSILTFQVGYDDAEYFSMQFSEEALPNDIVTLAKYNAYTKLMIDGMPSKTFSVATLPPPVLSPEEGRREKIIRLSRERYCTPREVVEDKIARWAEAGRLESAEKPSLPPKTPPKPKS